MHETYKVFSLSAPNKTWAVPSSLIKKLNLHEKRTVFLHCGSASVQVRVLALKYSRRSSKTIGLSHDIIKALNIPDNSSFQIKCLGNRHFCLGPVIAILTFKGDIRRKLSYYTHFARRNTGKGLLYVFQSPEIHPDSQTITGYHYDNISRRWHKRNFPYPDTVIDRCYPNNYQAHDLLEQTIGTGKIFNKTTMIDKRMFYNALKDDKYLSEFIPATRVFQTGNDFITFLHQHQELFLKPTNAMKGKGIVVVKPYHDGMLECRYTVRGQNSSRLIVKPGKLQAVLNHAAGRERPYVMQQAITRMDFRGGPFSFRTQAMKNGQGQWVIPGIFAKAAPVDGLLTNYCAGAKLVALETLISAILPRTPYSRRQLLRFLEDLTIRTAAILDQEYGPLGELGLDIVFDINGKPWLIEANGNPGNIPIFLQKDYPEWPHLIFQYPLDYAAYLAGFSQ